MPHVIEIGGRRPRIAGDAFVAPTAVLVGDVTLGAEASVWFGAVLRGDGNAIAIGARTNVQDNVVIHCNARHGTVVGADVTVGHGAVLEGCTVEDGCLIGMNATVLSDVRLGAGCLVAAGSVLLEGTRIEPGMLVAGVPAAARKPLGDDARRIVAEAPRRYLDLVRMYR